MGRPASLAARGDAGLQTGSCSWPVRLAKSAGARLILYKIWILPFAALLLAIALFPLLLPERWAHLKFQALVAGVASLPVLLRFVLHGAGGLAAVVHEYISFVVLLGSLYVVASGIVVDGDVPATPRTNILLLLLGGVLASVIGTTGASMLLIRLVLDVNVERKNVSHTVLFFILIVSNVGGSLTPIGDPPLFLGYLAGVPFFWTLLLFKQWVVALGIFLLAVYYLIDRHLHARETHAALVEDEAPRSARSGSRGSGTSSSSSASSSRRSSCPRPGANSPPSRAPP